MSFEKLGLRPDRDVEFPPTISMVDEVGTDPYLDPVKSENLETDASKTILTEEERQERDDA